jgi:hypothetical protein
MERETSQLFVPSTMTDQLDVTQRRVEALVSIRTQKQANVTHYETRVEQQQKKVDEARALHAEQLARIEARRVFLRNGGDV